jgi:hypothetical protein
VFKQVSNVGLLLIIVLCVVSGGSEERLLGVSLTGIMDNSLTSGQQGSQALQDALQQLRSCAVQVSRGQLTVC